MSFPSIGDIVSKWLTKTPINVPIIVSKQCINNKSIENRWIAWVRLTRIPLSKLYNSLCYFVTFRNDNWWLGHFIDLWRDLVIRLLLQYWLWDHCYRTRTCHFDSSANGLRRSNHSTFRSNHKLKYFLSHFECAYSFIFGVLSVYNWNFLSSTGTTVHNVNCYRIIVGDLLS